MKSSRTQLGMVGMGTRLAMKATVAQRRVCDGTGNVDAQSELKCQVNTPKNAPLNNRPPNQGTEEYKITLLLWTLYGRLDD